MTQKNSIFLHNFGDLAEIQRASYYRFLLSGLGEELKAIENPFWTCIYHPNSSSKKTLIVPCLTYLYFNDIRFEASQTLQQCLSQGITYSLLVFLRSEYSYDSKNISADFTYPYIGDVNISKITRVQQFLLLVELPLLTEDGTFVINGHERIVISQVIRSPGVYFRKQFGIGSKKIRYVATVISDRGNWTKIYFGREQEEKRLLDKLSLKESTFRESLVRKTISKKGVALLNKYFHKDTKKYKTEDLGNDQIFIKPSEFRRKSRLEQEIEKEEEKDRKEELDEVGLWIEKLEEHEDDKIYMMYLAEALERNIFFLFDNLTYMENEKNASTFNNYENIFAMSSNQLNDEVQQTMRDNENKTAAINLLNREGNERFSIGKAGRWRVNKKLGLHLPLEITSLTIHDFLKIVDGLFELKYFNRPSDDIDHLQNKMIRSVGELLQVQIQVGLYRLLQNFMPYNPDFFPIPVPTVKVKKKLKKSENKSIQKQSKKIPRNYLQYQYAFLFKEKNVKNKGKAIITNHYLQILAPVFDARILTLTVKEFFTTSQLSQFMDQINPLSEVAQKRRISVLGPNGLKRDNISNLIRDIHPSQYGRLCPIETPEGKNAGLVSSLSLFSRVNQWGAIETPYFLMDQDFLYRNLTPIYLDPHKEAQLSVAFCDQSFDIEEKNRTNFASPLSLTAYQEDYLSIKQDYLFSLQKVKEISFITTSPLQLISIGTALIPFVEHNDANRALMGSNMQRQAVPLICSQKPLVGTGLEATVCLDSGMVIKNFAEGKVIFVTSEKIIVQDISGQKIHYLCQKYKRSNQNTALNQRPLVWPGEKIYSGQIIADGAATNDGEFSVGQNLTLAYMPWEGYNYEDAIILNERLLSENILTSIHLEEYEIEIDVSNYRYAKERLTAALSHPVSPFQTRHLNPDGLIRVGSYVHEHDILIGRQRLSEHDLSGERKLIEALFPETAVDKTQPLYRDQSLRVEIGTQGRVVEVRIICPTATEAYEFSQLPNQIYQKNSLLQKKWETLSLSRKLHYVKVQQWDWKKKQKQLLKLFEIIKQKEILKNKYQNNKVTKRKTEIWKQQIQHLITFWDFLSYEENETEKQNLFFKLKHLDAFLLAIAKWKIISKSKTKTKQKTKNKLLFRILNTFFSDSPKDEITDEDDEEWLLFPQITIRIFVAQIRKIQVGDKLAGRHGNKGIISRLLSPQDMPYLPDGTSVDIIFNPLGVPSRMNVGQVFESLLGLAAEKLGNRFKVLPFDEMYAKEASRILINQKLKEAALKENCSWLFDPSSPGKILLRDGRTGDYFDNPITVGKSYILKLIHIVEEKINARATGPYALITEQPLAGKSMKGGQRFGEMEVWALEAYGCSTTLQELLTIKSDDIDGRIDMYESLSLQANLPKPSPSIPEAFLVLIRELNGLGLYLSFQQVNLDTPKINQTSQLDLFRVMETRLYLRAILNRKKVLEIANGFRPILTSSLVFEKEERMKETQNFFEKKESAKKKRK